MTRLSTSRKPAPAAAHQKDSAAVFAGVRSAAIAVLALGWALSASAERGLHFQNARPQHAASAPRPTPAPVERKPPPANNGQKNGFGGGPNHQHLAQWMESHQNLSLEQQQRALQQEPGFRQLPQETQQRLHDRLTQLNNMSPEQRQRVTDRTEAMERLSPDQRGQVRGALSALGALPQQRRMAVARVFRALRDMPDAQRQAYLNSPQMRTQFSDQERATLNNLFTVAPYLPPPAGPVAPIVPAAPH
jgi:hypothetical protein